MPGESWSYKFEESGTFSYYCTIHPWMEGIIIVEKEIPDYPHDATGTKLEFPLITIYSRYKHRSKSVMGSTSN